MRGAAAAGRRHGARSPHAGGQHRRGVLGRAPAGAVGHRPDHQVRRHRLSDPDRRRDPELRRARSTSTRRKRGASIRTSSTRSPPASWRWRTPRSIRPRSTPRASACCIGSGIGGITTLIEGEDVRTTKGFDRVSPFVIPMLIVNMALGAGLDALRRQGAELVGRDRLRHRQPRDRRRRPDHRARRRRRDDRGRGRGHDRPADHRRLLLDEGDVHAQRRAREGLAAVRRRPRRVRVRRGRRHRRAGGARARACGATPGSTPRSSATG